MNKLFQLYGRRKSIIALIFISGFLLSCNNINNKKINNIIIDPEFTYHDYSPKLSDLVISREKYLDKLQGFWLGECIANWT